MILHFLNGENSGKRQERPPHGAGIGRETDNEIQLLVGGVSRYHARVATRDGQWCVLDLGSTNGTKLNGELIRQAMPLKEGDLIAVGDQMFRVEDLPAPASTTVPATVSINNPKTDAEPAAAQPAFVFRPPEETAAPPQDDLKTVVTPLPDAPLFRSEKKDPEPEAPSSAPLFSGGSLFGRKKDKSAGADRNEDAAPSDRKRLSVNTLFYILVVMVAVLIVVIFWNLNQEHKNDGNASGTAQTASIIRNPFLLSYEKFAVTDKKSVFKLKVLVEKDHITFSLDDLQSGRVYAPVITDPVNPAAIEKLKKAIEDTSFMAASQQERFEDVADHSRSYSRLIVAFDDKFNDIMVSDIVLTSFTQVEDAVTTFLFEEYGLDSSMVASQDVLIREAKETFELAEKQFNSYKANPSHLWKSIENYRIAMKRYEVFAEKPAEWNISRDRFAEAQAIQEEIRKRGAAEVNLLYQKREYRRAVSECERLMEFFPPDSQTCQKIKQTKIKIEKILQGESK